MRAVGWALLVVLLLHLLGVGVFVGWLYTSGRVDGERVRLVVDTFKQTVDEAKAQEEDAAKLEAEAKEMAQRAARLEAVSDGPQTLQDRLATEQRADELAMHRLERLQRETGDLRRQIERAKELLAKQKEELDAERQAFDEFVKSTTQRLQDQDFQQAVAMYEQLKPRQAKQMFQQLIEQGKGGEVVDYLAAMQLRKAAAVLKEFKAPAEIEQATGLIQQLSDRGVYPVDGVAEASR